MPPDQLRFMIKALAGPTGHATLFNTMLDRIESLEERESQTREVLDRLMSDHQFVEYVTEEPDDGAEG